MRALLLLALVGCADLGEPLVPGTCGDGALDPGEDCDTVSPLVETTVCGGPDLGARACRYLCDSTADCPSGWVCNAGFCRHGSATYAASSARIGSADQVALEDLDLDGVAELVVRDGTLLTFSSWTDRFVPSFAAEVSAISGPFTITGNRTIALPRRYADDARIVELQLRETGVAAVPVQPDPIRLGAVPYRTYQIVPMERYDVEVWRQADEWIWACGPYNETVPAARFPASTDPPVRRTVLNVAGERVLALPVRDGIAMLRFGRFGCEVLDTTVVPIRDGWSLYSDDLLAVDVNDDLHEDLVFVTVNDADPDLQAIEVAYIDVLPATTTVLREVFHPALLDCGRELGPIALADIDGDGALDLIGRVFWETFDVEEDRFRDAGRFDGFLREGVADDFDHDGDVDLVVARLEEDRCEMTPDLSLYVGDGAGHFVRRPLRGVGAPELLRKGDFDGDFEPDVAMIDEDEGETRIMILFGGDLELKEVYRVPGRIEAMEAVVPLASSEPDDLLIVTADGMALPGRGMLRLEGTRERLLFAPARLEPRLGRDLLSVARAPGLFVTDGANFWSVPREGESISGSGGLPCGLFADWEGELFGVSGFVHEGFNGCETEQVVEVAVGRVDRDVPELDVASVPVSRGVAKLRSFSLTNIDGGGPEAVLQYERRIELTPELVACAPGDGGAAILWNLNQEEIRQGMRPRVTEFIATPGRCVVDAAVLDADGLDPPDTAVLYRDRIEVAGEVHPLERSVDRARLLTGDVDGDGLTDMVVAGEGRAEVFLACPQDEPCP